MCLQVSSAFEELDCTFAEEELGGLITEELLKPSSHLGAYFSSLANFVYHVPFLQTNMTPVSQSFISGVTDASQPVMHFVVVILAQTPAELELGSTSDEELSTNAEELSANEEELSVNAEELSVNEEELSANEELLLL